MELRTFVGTDLQETLAQVKRELGPEAVILSTQSRRLGPGDNGRGRREVKIVAALTGPGASPGSAREDSRTAAPPLLVALHQEMRELKNLVCRRLGGEGIPEWLQAYPEILAFHQHLAGRGLSAPVLERWLERVRLLLAENREGQEEVGMRALQSLFCITSWRAPGSRRPLCRVLVGTSGVGKTTTLAKLAVKAALVEGRPVGLISLDHARLGALEQLAAFARLADLPLYAATSRAELARILETFRDCEEVFIDTPGLNPCRPELGSELQRLLGGLPVECHLLVSAGASEPHLSATFRALRFLPLASLMITKVDETRDLTGCLHQVLHRGLSLSYLTTGPRVPEDLEPATPARLAALLVGPWREGPLFPSAPQLALQEAGHAGV